jgi:hypothetical protein
VGYILVLNLLLLVKWRSIGELAVRDSNGRIQYFHIDNLDLMAEKLTNKFFNKNDKICIDSKYSYFGRANVVSVYKNVRDVDN